MALHFQTIGNYRLVEELAEGAFGRVYRAEHMHLMNRIVAIKLLHTRTNTEKEREDFLQEARILGLFKHPHILPIVDFGIQEGTPYLITEFASGGSLRDRLKQTSTRLLSLDESLRILRQVAQALHTAHQQKVVHRDLKPENILFDSEGNVLLADFGISTILSVKSIKTTAIVGTPSYMAPEQFKGHVSKESDQYALGCIAYELLAEHKPFTAPDFFSMGIKHMTEVPPPPTQFNPRLPAYISQAILKAMTKDRHQRFPDVLDFVDALEIDYLKKGSKFYQQQQYADALEAYEQALRLYSDQQTAFIAHTGKCIVLYRIKRHEEALNACEQALQLKPDDWTTHYNKGLILDDLQRYQEALDAYTFAAQLNPNAIDAYNNQGVVLRKLGQHQDALAAYERAIQAQPNDATAHYNKGQVLYHLKRYEEALTAYTQAIRLNPDDATAYNHQGVILYTLKRYEEALVSYEQALRLRPNYLAAYNNMGNVLNYLKRYQEALNAYEQAIQIDPQYATAYHNKSIALRNLQRHADAEAQQAEEMAQRLGYKQ
jgi:serine/threonine protein kinase/lipoprotein NlpI